MRKKLLPAVMAASFVLSACGAAYNPQPIQTPPAPIYSPKATVQLASDPLSTPTPPPEMALRGEIAVALGTGPIDWEDWLAENGKTREETLILLGQVPPWVRIAFLREYFHDRSALLRLLEETRAVVPDGDFMCYPGELAVMIVPGTYPPKLHSQPVPTPPPGAHPFRQYFSYLRALPDGVTDLPAELADGSVILPCDSAGSRAYLETREEVVRESVVRDEELAEAVLAAAVTESFLRAFGESPADGVEITGPLLGVDVRNKDGSYLLSNWYEVSSWDDRRALEAVFADHPEYQYLVRGAGGLSSSPAAMVYSGVWTEVAAFHEYAHRLAFQYPFGNLGGEEGRIFQETFAGIVQDELFTEFMRENYPDLAASDEWGPYLASKFDGNGRHPLPTEEQWTEGGTPLGRSIISLRNCTMDLGRGLDYFLGLMKQVEWPEDVELALRACQAEVRGK